MRHISTVALALILALGLAGQAWADNTTFNNVIPGRFAFLVITGIKPDEKLNKDAIVQQLTSLMKEQLKVQKIQYIIYNEGQKFGVGTFRAYGELITTPENEIEESVELEEFTDTEDAATKGKMVNLEKAIGFYEIDPKDLWEAYSSNEVVADEDFKGKAVIMTITVPGVSKDFKGDPYINVPADGIGFSGIHLKVAKDDPLLRSIKKGSKIIFRGNPQGMLIKDVIVTGDIVQILQ